jgi:hypothetical protein
MNLGPDDVKYQRLMGPLNRMYGHLRAERQGTLDFSHLLEAVS